MTFRALVRRLSVLVRRRRAERDLSEELAFHIARETARLTATDLEPARARAEATARFGSVALAADRVRDAWGTRLAQEWMADTRYAFRQFGRRPFVTLAMMGVLAVGLAFPTAIFVIVNSLDVSRPAGVPADPALVRIRGIDHSRGPGRTIGREFSLAELRSFTSVSGIFDEVAGWASADATLDVGIDSPRIESGAVTFVTPAYFTALGLRPTVGRWPSTSPDTGQTSGLAGVISDAIWRRFYDASPSVVGQRLKLNGVPIAIVGVAPPRFAGARTGGSVVRVWLPLDARPIVQPGSEPLTDGLASFGIVARLKPGISLDEASAAVRGLSAATPHPHSSTGWSADVVPLLASNYFPPSGEQEQSGGIGRLVGLSAPLLLLAVMATSVSALLAGTSLARRREIAIRVAVGAGRRRVVRQLLTETTWLGLLAACAALGVLSVIIRVVDASFLEVPLTLDWRAGLFAGVVALGTSLALGISPALNATRQAQNDILRAGSATRSSTGLQASLVVLQIGLTLPVLLMMGTMVLTLGEDLRPRRARADQIVDVRFNLNPRYGAIDERREQAIDRVQDRLRQVPGVTGVVALGEDDGGTVSAGETMRDGPSRGEDVEITIRPMPPGYVAVMGIPVVFGRDASVREPGGDRSALVNQELATRLWGGGNVVGRQFTIDSRGPRRYDGPFTVVGVIDDPGTERVYVPRPDSRPVTTALFVTSDRAADSLIPRIREAGLAAAPELPMVSARTIATIEAESARTTLRGIGFGTAVGLLALTLAAVGLYAVGAVAIEARRREIGIRAALGSDAPQLVRRFVLRGVSLCGLGLVLGLALSGAGLRVLAATTGNATPPGTLLLLAGVSAFVLMVGVVAAWIPARRAAAIDPLTVMRSE